MQSIKKIVTIHINKTISKRGYVQHWAGLARSPCWGAVDCLTSVPLHSVLLPCSVSSPCCQAPPQLSSSCGPVCDASSPEALYWGLGTWLQATGCVGKERGEREGVGGEGNLREFEHFLPYLSYIYFMNSLLKFLSLC